MLRYVVFLVFFVMSFSAHAELITRKSGEGTENFVVRMAPANTEVTHVIIETKEWKFRDDVIVAFYEQAIVDEKTDAIYTVITGFVFVPTANGRYEKIEIDSYGPENGGSPNIETVLFANTDKTPDKKIVLIVSWPQHRAGAKGTLYATYVYDKPSLNPIPKKLIFFKEISKKLSGGCECIGSDGRKKTVKFKTASDINVELKKLAN